MTTRRSNGRRARQPAAANWRRRRYLEDALAWYRDVADDAHSRDSYVAAVRARQAADAIRKEIDQIDAAAAAASVAIPETLDERFASLLVELRQLRAAATAGQSYVAAKDLLRVEADLVEAERARRDAENERGRDLEALLDRLEKVLEGMPPVLRMRLAPVLESFRPSEPAEA